MANENKERCPKCFSKFGEWTDDPILTKNGAKFIYDESSGLLIPNIDIEQRFYKGFYQIKSQIIKELQENREQAEIDAGIAEEERTIFSHVEDDANGFWVINIKHIKELRESTEKILNAIGTDKETYFNYDDEGIERQNPHQTDWIDPILDNWKGHIKDQHIEDLRKFIVTFWIEPFNEVSPNISNSGNIIMPPYTADPVMILCPEVEFTTIKGDNTRTYIFGGTTSWGTGEEEYLVSLLGNWQWGTGSIIGEVLAHNEPDGIEISSSKIHMKYNAQISANSASSLYVVGGYRIVPKEDYVINLKINKIITSKTRLTIDSSFTYDIQLCIINDYFNYATAGIFVTLSNGSLLWWKCGKAWIDGNPDPSLISLSEFNNFNRNLYDDYITQKGTPPPSEIKITGFYIKLESWLWAKNNQSGYATMEWYIDNIKFQ